MKGHEAILRQFLANGIDHMFGNPGTVEQGFLDALADVPEMRYVLTLQESIAVLCADGYARSVFGPALVQIHSAPGLGNAIGNLYQAYRGQAPLVVIGGDAGIKYQAMDAQMAADLVAMARPVTKWSAMVQHPSSLLRMVRRAIKIACTPPCGPVYLCLPEDILDAEIVEEIFPAHIPSFDTRPEAHQLEALVDMIRAAQNPIILAGDGVAWTSTVGVGNNRSDNNLGNFVRLAEHLGAKVYEADGGEINFPEDHPLNYGSTGHMFGSASLPLIQEADFCLVLGCYLLPEVFPHLGDIFSPDTLVVHVDTNPNNIAKNHRVDQSFVCNPAAFIEQMLELLESKPDPIFEAVAQQRQARLIAESPLHHSTVEDLYQCEPPLPSEQYDDHTTYMRSGYFIKTLAEKLPADHIIFDEALTNSPPVGRLLPGRVPGEKMMTRGGSLGTGFPGAIGAKLAHPEKTVVGFSGDGGSMYTIQCLWTAARHGVAAKFVVCQNRSYRLLQANITQFWKERGIEGREFPQSFDLSNPEISFDIIAHSFGVPGERVWRPDQVPAAVDRMLAHNGPYLINLVLEGDVNPELVGVHCGQ
jgi:thiamine pyrophosphate-dependent acetolactate synthase large subunit-like protein